MVLSEEVVRTLFRRLKQDGILDVIVNSVLEPHADALELQLRGCLTQHLLHDHEVQANALAHQGGLIQVRKIIRVFEQLGEQETRVEPQEEVVFDPYEEGELDSEYGVDEPGEPGYE